MGGNRLRRAADAGFQSIPAHHQLLHFQPPFERGGDALHLRLALRRQDEDHRRAGGGRGEEAQRHCAAPLEKAVHGRPAQQRAVRRGHHRRRRGLHLLGPDGQDRPELYGRFPHRAAGQHERFLREPEQQGRQEPALHPHRLARAGGGREGGRRRTRAEQGGDRAHHRRQRQQRICRGYGAEGAYGHEMRNADKALARRERHDLLPQIGPRHGHHRNGGHGAAELSDLLLQLDADQKFLAWAGGGDGDDREPDFSSTKPLRW